MTIGDLTAAMQSLWSVHRSCVKGCHQATISQPSLKGAHSFTQTTHSAGLTRSLTHAGERLHTTYFTRLSHAYTCNVLLILSSSFLYCSRKAGTSCLTPHSFLTHLILNHSLTHSPSAVASLLLQEGGHPLPHTSLRSLISF
jgi:hypothetical protein